MAIQARLDAVAERFLFRQIDGGKLVLDEFAGALTAELLPFWRLGSLYGVTASEAFRVDVRSVNTDATIANGELHALAILRVSQFAEEVILEITKAPITETL
jgi:hypothetical protein